MLCAVFFLLLQVAQHQSMSVGLEANETHERVSCTAITKQWLKHALSHLPDNCIHAFMLGKVHFCFMLLCSSIQQTELAYKPMQRVMVACCTLQ